MTINKKHYTLSPLPLARHIKEGQATLALVGTASMMTPNVRNGWRVQPVVATLHSRDEMEGQR